MSRGYELLGRSVWLRQHLVSFAGNTFYKGDQLKVVEYQEGEYLLVDKVGHRIYCYEEHFDTLPVKAL